MLAQGNSNGSRQARRQSTKQAMPIYVEGGSKVGLKRLQHNMLERHILVITEKFCTPLPKQ